MPDTLPATLLDTLEVPSGDDEAENNNKKAMSPAVRKRTTRKMSED